MKVTKLFDYVDGSPILSFLRKIKPLYKLRHTDLVYVEICDDVSPYLIISSSDSAVEARFTITGFGDWDAPLQPIKLDIKSFIDVLEKVGCVDTQRCEVSFSINDECLGVRILNISTGVSEEVLQVTHETYGTYAFDFNHIVDDGNLADTLPVFKIGNSLSLFKALTVLDNSDWDTDDNCYDEYSGERFDVYTHAKFSFFDVYESENAGCLMFAMDNRKKIRFFSHGRTPMENRSINKSVTLSVDTIIILLAFKDEINGGLISITEVGESFYRVSTVMGGYLLDVYGKVNKGDATRDNLTSQAQFPERFPTDVVEFTVGSLPEYMKKHEFDEMTYTIRPDDNKEKTWVVIVTSPYIDNPGLNSYITSFHGMMSGNIKLPFTIEKFEHWAFLLKHEKLTADERLRIYVDSETGTKFVKHEILFDPYNTLYQFDD